MSPAGGTRIMVGVEVAGQRFGCGAAERPAKKGIGISLSSCLGGARSAGTECSSPSSRVWSAGAHLAVGVAWAVPGAGCVRPDLAPQHTHDGVSPRPMRQAGD